MTIQIEMISVSNVTYMYATLPVARSALQKEKRRMKGYERKNRIRGEEEKERRRRERMEEKIREKKRRNRR